MTAVVEPDLAPPVLEAVNLEVGYGTFPVVSGIDLTVRAGEVVAFLGANGAGKSTTLLALAGVIRPSGGTVRLFGHETTATLHQRSRQGLGFLPESKSVIFALSVIDNLRLGRGDLDAAFELFPELVPLRKRLAGTLSGGEQQMLAFARALSRRPRVLLADELSLGLAPLVVERLGVAISAAAATGIGVLVVEQQVHTALSISQRAYVLQRGRIVLEGVSAHLLGRVEEIESAYLST